ncbi:unnamed protein product [Tenebrio molitor]|nr:unnamed protein product [Tenebrio molitor]
MPNLMNFDDTTLKLTVINPLVLLRFDYEVDGKLFLLVLKSSGLAESDVHHLTQTFTFALDEYKKNSFPLSRFSRRRKF